MTTEEQLAKGWHAADACNLRGVLREFTRLADQYWPQVGNEPRLSTNPSPERLLLVLWFDIVANILGHPSIEEVGKAYDVALKATEHPPTNGE